MTTQTNVVTVYMEAGEPPFTAAPYGRCLCGKAFKRTSPHDHRRKWCSERCRKNLSYGGTCQRCGNRTSGGDGAAKAPALCASCSEDRNREERTIWSKERIVEEIHRWTSLAGRPPKATEWQRAGTAAQKRLLVDIHRATGPWPTVTVVQRKFGSWANAIEAADFPRPTRGVQGPRRRHEDLKALHHRMTFDEHAA
jgi:hypothetical protein